MSRTVNSFCLDIVVYQNRLIYADFGNSKIVSVNPEDFNDRQTLCSIKDELEPKFNFPSSISLFKDDLYIINRAFQFISKLNLKTRTVSTLFSTDFGNILSSICVYDEETIYVIAGLRIQRLRKINNEWILENFAGDGRKGYINGKLLEASFEEPTDLICFNDMILVSDQESSAIRQISNDEVTTLTEEVNLPQSMCLTDYGTILVLEGHGKIKEVTMDGEVRVFDDYEDETGNFKALCIDNNYIYRTTIGNHTIIQTRLPKLTKSAKE